jgi:hypothetical protein
LSHAADYIGGKEVAYDFALYDMCDRGVRERHKRGGIWFKIWSTEAEKVKAYMARKHPGIEYRMSWPEWK